MTAQTAFENIPEELRSYPQWVCHDAAKRPINPHTGQLADVSDPTTWGSFDQARAIADAGRCAGVGFVFTDSDPFVGIDLDVSEGAGPSDGQQRIFGAFNTYAEQSPSGRGLHIIAKGRVADGGVRNSALGVVSLRRRHTENPNRRHDKGRDHAEGNGRSDRAFGRKRAPNPTTNGQGTARFPAWLRKVCLARMDRHPGFPPRYPPITLVTVTMGSPV